MYIFITSGYTKKNECNYENLLLRLQKQQAEQQAEFQKRMLEFMKKAS